MDEFRSVDTEFNQEEKEGDSVRSLDLIKQFIIRFCSLLPAVCSHKTPYITRALSITLCEHSLLAQTIITDEGIFVNISVYA